MREVLGELDGFEVARLGPAWTASSTEGPLGEAVADLAAIVAADPIVGPRIEQKLFATHCERLLAILDPGTRMLVLGAARALVSRIPGLSQFGSLATEAGIGWLLTHPRFVDQLFYAPGLLSCDARALLHHVPKTGGTSLNLYVAQHVSDAYLFFPCTTFGDQVALGGALAGVDIVNELSSRPRSRLVMGGHYNLADAVRRSGFKRVRCVSLYGAPDRLLSSGLRRYLSIAASDGHFAQSLGLDDASRSGLARALAGDGPAIGEARAWVDRVLSSGAFRDHFQDPLSRWCLPTGFTQYRARLASFESLMAKTESFVCYEHPSLDCVSELGLTVNPAAMLGRENASVIRSEVLEAWVGARDWLSDRFRAHDLVGASEAFHTYLTTQHAEARACETTSAG